MVDRFASVLTGFTLLLIGLAVSPAFAHEGHDHGAPPPPVSATIAPRADASTVDIELVAVARGERLEIFLDSFKGNEPISGASLEIDSPAGTIKAEAMGEGTYVAAAPWLAQSGSYDLAITVMAGDLFDVLTITMAIPEKATSAEPVAATDGFLVSTAWAQGVGARLQRPDLTLLAVGGGGVVLGLLIALLFRRRKSTATVAAIAAILIFAGTPESQAAGLHCPACRPLSGMSPSGLRMARSSCRRPRSASWRSARSSRNRPHMRGPWSCRRGSFRSHDIRLCPGIRVGKASAALRRFPPTGRAVSAGDVLALVQPSVGAADLTSQQQQARELGPGDHAGRTQAPALRAAPVGSGACGDRGCDA